MGKFSGIVDERGAMTCFSVSRLVRRHGREGAENGEGRKGLLVLNLAGESFGRSHLPYIHTII